MINHYSQIIKIERIQNERWYKKYAAHREDFYQRYRKHHTNLEKLLFHGCLETSALQIIQDGFDRSHAGVNDVVYGWGVYFADSARYSHR
ncbi:unnamed protein product, partial [Didymodactylos carnosus]